MQLQIHNDVHHNSKIITAGSVIDISEKAVIEHLLNTKSASKLNFNTDKKDKK